MSSPTRPDELLDHLDGLRMRARNDRRAGSMFGAALAVIGLGLLALGILQRNLPIEVTAGLFGTVGVLESFFVISILRDL